MCHGGPTCSTNKVPVHEALLAEIYQVQSAIGQMTLVLFRRRALGEQCGAEQRLGRAFEKAPALLGRDARFRLYTVPLPRPQFP
jgi:hypothetical protein